MDKTSSINIDKCEEINDQRALFNYSKPVFGLRYLEVQS